MLYSYGKGFITTALPLRWCDIYESLFSYQITPKTSHLGSLVLRLMSRQTQTLVLISEEL